MTHAQIEQYVLDYLVEKQLLSINGGYYRNEMRPFNSTKEDCVVGVLDADANQVQSGVLNINVFICDVIKGDGINYRNLRCDDIALELDNLVDELNQNGEIRFMRARAVRDIELTELKQHCVSLQLRFLLLTTY